MAVGAFYDSRMSEFNGQFQKLDGFQGSPFQCFDVKTVVVTSPSLAGNPLQDPVVRWTPVLVPKEASSDTPVVVILAGFMGNGPSYFNLKTFESNLPQSIDKHCLLGEAPKAFYVFVEAMTAWGGSQFINSQGTGKYENYIVEDLLPTLRAVFPEISLDPKKWCVTGGSSGGYGALHLASRHPRLFALCAALAPDSYFESSLLPDLYSTVPVIGRLGGVEGVRNELQAGRLMKRRDAHKILNTIAMGLCYCPNSRGGVEFPIELETGLLKEEAWARWKMHDPCEFLRVLSDNLLNLEGVFLEVGRRDEFCLYYGARQIRNLLTEVGVNPHYVEFDGGHFDLSERRPNIWKWLLQYWEPQKKS